MLTAYIFVLYAGRSIRAGAFLDESCGNQQGTVKNESVLAEVASNEAMLSNYRDASALWYVLLVLLGLLVCREALQLGVAPRRYFFSLENWVEGKNVKENTFRVSEGILF